MYVPRKYAGTRKSFVITHARTGNMRYMITPAMNNFKTIWGLSCDTVEILFNMIQGQVTCTIILDIFLFASAVKIPFLNNTNPMIIANRSLHIVETIVILSSSLSDWQ